ncbi:methyl-accepting chemotaxis protein, partial [Vibrio sinaloensis]
NIIAQFQKDSKTSLTSVDAVCETAHTRSNQVESLSLAMNEVVSEMQQALAHARSIQDQTSSTTEIHTQIQGKVEVITQHADETSHSAAKTRDISMNLEQLSEHLESLINQFALSQRK